MCKGHKVQRQGSMGPGSTKKASAAAAEGEGQVMRLRKTGGQIRQGLEGQVMDRGFHYT